MRADGLPAARARIRQSTGRRSLGVLLVVLAFGSLTGPVAAGSADPRIEAAERESAEALGRLDELLQRIQALEQQVGGIDGRLAELRAQATNQQAQADQAQSTTSGRVWALYALQSTDPGLAMLTGESPGEAAQRTQILEFLARSSQGQGEVAEGATRRSQVEVETIEGSIPELERQLAELGALKREAEAAAQREVAELERIRQRVAAEADGGFAPVVGGLACPVGAPRTYSDTYGAARSGGRAHRGTDILAAHGIPIYAIESGTVTRMSSNRLGGTSLYLKGDSGNLYYYTHLSSYVSGISVGQKVEAGQQVARNGMTGNAPVPHLHFEVRPGGGGNVNPYPYVRQACG